MSAESKQKHSLEDISGSAKKGVITVRHLEIAKRGRVFGTGPIVPTTYQHNIKLQV